MKKSFIFLALIFIYGSLSAQISGQGQEDPLIALKAQDLAQKAKKEDQDTAIDMQRLELDKQRNRR